MAKRILSTICLIFIITIFTGVYTNAYAQDAGESCDVNTGECTAVPINTANSHYDLVTPPNATMNLEVPNPGNLPFIHDKRFAELDEDTGRYGTVKNEGAYLALSEVIEFSIKILIKLVGVMSLFGVTEGLIRLVVAHGDEEVHRKGIQMIFWSIIGLLLSLIAHALVTALLQFVTGVGTLDI